MRWEHPERGLLHPDMFIPVAEDTGIIEALGRFVLRAACEQATQWHRDHPGLIGLSVSVNVSPRQLRDPRIVDDVAEVLAATSPPPECLTLEITESAMMRDAEVALVHLTALRDLGVRLAVDDFGTGYSSLSYLQRFPIDILKIDRSFVKSMDQGPEDSALARAIVRLAQTLRLVAVAEGVETTAQADLLLQLGCPLAQGFLYSKPEPPAALRELLLAAERRSTALAPALP